MSDVSEVLAGRAPWACVESDAVAFLEALPDDSVDLLMTSPPYEDSRTYSMGFGLKGQEWVDWMHGVIRAAAPKVKGLIAVNCEGRTRNYSYTGTPFLLFADLLRAGFNMRKPCVYERDGIPGSGGPDWLKNRWEPIICVTRPGKLPWSDNTACGHEPKCQAGGAVSHRNKEGLRRSFKTQTRRKSDGDRSEYHGQFEGRAVPDLANPGNIIDCGADTHFGFGNESEAPFPLKLADFFVRSFCPPNGIVCDIFSGSGTTCHAAVEAGRRFVGCDLRESQVSLCSRRMKTVTPDLFAGVADE